MGPEDVAALAGVSRETTDRLKIYVALLERWQRAINLVSTASLADVWRRHIWDSAQLVPLAPDRAHRWLDLGAGAGFPGLVVALLLKERGAEAVVELVESDQRKAAFLREAIRVTEAPARVQASRIEAVTPFSADVISARALAPLDRLFLWAEPFWAPHSVGLFLKGRQAGTEIAAARTQWDFQYDQVPSRSDSGGIILVVKGLQRG